MRADEDRRPLKTPETDAQLAPVNCPFCGSSKIKTTGERADASCYWRCEGCGDMWNDGRLRASPARLGGARRWP